MNKVTWYHLQQQEVIGANSFEWTNGTVRTDIFDNEIPNMRTTIAEGLLTSCCDMKGSINLFLSGISCIMLVYIGYIAEEVILFGIWKLEKHYPRNAILWKKHLCASWNSRKSVNRISYELFGYILHWAPPRLVWSCLVLTCLALFGFR